MASAPAATVSAAGQRERLARLLEQRIAEGGPALFPLSYNQSSLWYLNEYAPGTSAYSVGFAAWVRSEPDVEALERALQAVVDRHPSLRTRFFATVHGRPLQQAEPRLPLTLERVDASDWDDETLAARVQAAYDRPVDLGRAPGLRAQLFDRGPDGRVLLLVAHHTLLDLWGLSIVLAELGELYAAETSGSEPDLPSLPADYGRFVRWQSELIADDQGAAQRAYWEEALRGANPVLNLPTDRPRPPLQTFGGDSLTFVLDAERTAAVAALAREERTSLYVLLLAAFQTLLHRYTEQEDVLVGSPVAGRSRPEFDGVVGHFVNMIVLRGQLGGNPSFRRYLAQVRDTVLGALEHQDYPFAALVEQLALERDPSRSPLFQVCFALQRAPKLDGLASFLVRSPGAAPLDLGGLVLEPFPLSQQQGQFDLSLWMAEADGMLHGELKFNAALFDEPTIARMAEHFQTLLDGVLADPDTTLADLPLLGEGERGLVVDEWNRTPAPYRSEACMHELFEEQVSRAPDAVAATLGAQALTYGDVEERANRIAHHLRALGVNRGSLVGVYLDRSLDVVPALLGILKAGAGYVPLETYLPPARVELILSSLAIRAVVTQTAHVPALQALDVPLLEHLVCVDDAAPASVEGAKRVWSAADLQTHPVEAPARVSRAEDTAYVIFTSGSTGTPKGVEVKHRPAINLIEWVNSTHGVSPADRLLFITSLSFDLSVYDLFGTLAAGASLRIAQREDVQDPDRLVRILVEEPITFWDSAPPALAQLVAFLPERAEHSPLRLVFLSGDWIPLRLPDQIRAVFPRAQVVSLGGATEATIWSNWFPIGEIEPHWVSIPYGRPIQNARYYVLDPLRRPSPIGIPGDLFIGGECLAAGYINDPELTDAKFVPDPFVDVPEARMYSTGDRARFFPDGNIEFLGRRDFQVKIRGYRIELGEIETVLNEHPAIAESAVIARDEGGREKYLAAYVVPQDGEPAVTPTDLRAYLKQRLPEYMVPPFFVSLERLPITPSGKLDRKALPVPEQRREELGGAYTAPSTPVEEALAAIWAKVLGIDRVGVDDNFFELGGHSLLAVQVVHEIERELGPRLPVSVLLQSATITDLARRLEAGTETASLLVPLRTGHGEETVFLIHPTGGEVVAYRHLVEGLDARWNLVGVQSRALAGEAEHASIEAMAEEYAAAIRGAQPSGPYRLAGWSLGGVVAHAVAAALERQGEEVAFLGLVDSGLPRDRPDLRETLAYRLGTELGSLAGLLAGEPADELASLLALPVAARVEAALSHARERGLLAGEVSAEVVAREIDLARAHDEILAAHAPARVAAPLQVWWAEESLLEGVAPTDWEAYTSASVESSVVGGVNHYAIVQPPHAAVLAAQLDEALGAG